MNTELSSLPKTRKGRSQKPNLKYTSISPPAEQEGDSGTEPGGAPRRSLRKRKVNKLYDGNLDIEELNDESKKKKIAQKVFHDMRTLCQQLLTNLMKHEYSWPFNQPVDPAKFGLVDYFQKIPHPMDFSTIQKKIDVGSYSESDEFGNDVRLVFANCLAYNDHVSDIAYMAMTLSALFEEQFTEIKRREAKIINKQEIGEMKSVIDELRGEHQKLLGELQKLVKNRNGTDQPTTPPDISSKHKKKAKKPKK